ncbi:enamine deaminase RidA (YjgF/YER057c/UK114 family) [Methylorubrum rhodinum]|uniref:Enamine deaminase RidA (YjgF/YER057c/UK114 family) n=1 Tax=Methylorubrum rhodinum TaxID=29428 RepID=A0A840ZQB5_9HYPH|nr:enamine deaminase RidA (YjgF/YER057c/UK114 family) [Methylorubrum rhodinum]
MSKRDAVSPADRHALYDAHRYSAAIRSGDLLFVSGQVGSRDDGSPEPTFEAQVRRAFANLRAVLAVAGCTFDDVVDVTTFHTDPQAQFEIVMAVRDAEIGEPPLPQLDGRRRHVARGLRLRDQGHSPDTGDRLDLKQIPTK